MTLFHHSRAVVNINRLLALDNFHVYEPAGAASPYLAFPASMPLTLEASASFRVIPQVCNSFGSLHGGAAAILAERAALALYHQAARWAGERSQHALPRVRSLSIDYMSPCTKNTELLLLVRGMRVERGAGEGDKQSPSRSLFPPLDVAPHPQGNFIPMSCRVLFTRKKDGRYLTQCHVLLDSQGDAWHHQRQSRSEGNRARL